jgi:hypothetical protein
MKTKRLLERFERVYNISDIPRTGTFFVLTMSNSFLGKSIQGFMRLIQYLHFTNDTQRIPNHCDVVSEGVAIGALADGVKKHYIADHFNKKAEYFYIIRPVQIDFKTFKKSWPQAREQTLWNTNIHESVWEFASAQEGEGYKYFDILWHAIKTVTLKWLGEKEVKESDMKYDRDKWTCYSLGASSYNYAVNDNFFPDPIEITPLAVCQIVHDHPNLFT